MISVKHEGSFKNILKYLDFSRKDRKIEEVLSRYGREGIQALSMNTPVDSGETASMWDYEIHKSNGRYELVWTNDNINDGIPIAILLQYGHATRNGGYVQGIDYINPAMRPLFDKMAENIWREVASL